MDGFGSQSSSATQWSLVIAAGAGGEIGARALATLCRRYWPAVFAYVRRRAKSIEDAQDLTQEFFVQFLERAGAVRADPQRGRFRAFLFTSVRNFLIDQAQRGQALRRGGGVRILPFDMSIDGSAIRFEPWDECTPEAEFERRWAEELLARTLDRLRAWFRDERREGDFDTLLPYLGGPPEGVGHEPLAGALGVSEVAARQAASRFRRRYRDLLRDEVGQTLADPTDADIDAELATLFRAVVAVRPQHRPG